MASRTYNPETPWRGKSYIKHGKGKTVRELRENELRRDDPNESEDEVSNAYKNSQMEDFLDLT